MAQAGFVYTPQVTEDDSRDDTATCLYCNISLGGWDPEDDPLYEFSFLSFSFGVSNLYRVVQRRTQETREKITCSMPFLRVRNLSPRIRVCAHARSAVTQASDIEIVKA